MDPNEDIAEERLLKVIEGKRARVASDHEVIAMPGHGPGGNPFKKMKNLFSGAKGAGMMHFNLQLLNNLLWLVLIGVTVYLAVDFMYFQKMTSGPDPFHLPGLKKNMSASEGANVSESAPPERAEIMVPLSEVMIALQDRDPFTGREAVRAKLPQEEKGPEVNLSELTAGLILTGINKGPPAEAFIEDSEMKRTYFVTVGQQIRNMVVKEITGSTVICDYEGQEVQIG